MLFTVNIERYVQLKDERIVRPNIFCLCFFLRKRLKIFHFNKLTPIFHYEILYVTAQLFCCE